MTTSSYYRCPKCHEVLILTEHYHPQNSKTAFLSLDFVTLECQNCRLRGKGTDEGEAYQNLYAFFKGKEL